jgi:RNA polymerase sigma-70 factor (ECF subfamily)
LSDDLRQLVNRCLAGDQAAMTQFVDRFRGQIFGLCYRMLRHRQDAEEMAQETFIRALKSLQRWDATREMEPWLLAIAGNRCRTLLAKRLRRPAPQSLLSEPPDNDAAQTQAAQNLAEEVHAALMQIRAEYRQAFVLFHENELSYDEIAQTMECPLGTVKTWIHRARRELIDRLRDREVIAESRCELRTV